MPLLRALLLLAATVPLVVLTGEGAWMPAAAQTADPQQLCGGPQTTADDWVKGCSAIIDSGQAHGRELAAAYAQRGFAFTLKRNLEGPEGSRSSHQDRPRLCVGLCQPRQFLDGF